MNAKERCDDRANQAGDGPDHRNDILGIRVVGQCPEKRSNHYSQSREDDNCPPLTVLELLVPSDTEPLVLGAILVTSTVAHAPLGTGGLHRTRRADGPTWRW